MKKALLGLGIASILAGCSSPNCCTVVDTNVDIRYVDAKGQDWLRTNAVTDAGMEVYFVFNGKKQRVYQPTMDAPKSIRLFREPDTARTVLRLFPSDAISDTGESMTLLEFPDHSVDTVRCRFDRSNDNLICTDVRYNSQLHWASTMHTLRGFTVRK